MPIKKQVVKARVDWGACPFGSGFLCTGAPNLPPRQASAPFIGVVLVSLPLG